MNKEKDIRIELRVRNNLILQLMEEHGITTVAELCRRAGIPSQQAEVGLIINMRQLPCRPTPSGGVKWRPCIKKIAALFQLVPDMLFSEQQMEVALETNRAQLEMSSYDIRALVAAQRHNMSPYLLAEDTALREEIFRQLKTLTPRQEQVIKQRFGLDGEDEQTLQQVAKATGWSVSKVRHIETDALKRLRHPIRARPLLVAGACEHRQRSFE